MDKNVVLVTVDSLRFDAVFSDGLELNLTSFDKLQGNLTKFSTGFANAPYTADSFTSILGGTYPWKYGTTTEGFESDRPHIAELFSEEGYRTGGFFSNPYLGPSFDYDRGWNHYTLGGTENESSDLETLKRFVVENINRESKVFELLKWAHRTIGETLGIELEGRPYPPAEEITDSVLEWLSGVGDDPVFAWVHYMDVHSPFYPHRNTVSEAISQREALRTFYAVNKRPTEATPEELDRLRRLYRGEIEYLDRSLHRLFDGVETELDPENTVVLFTSDHGEAFDEHGFCFHPKELYDELVHIPIILKSPTIEVNKITTPTSNLDLISILSDVCEIKQPAACDGDSPLHSEDNERYVFAQAVDNTNMKVMVTDGRWKLIRSIQNNEEKLFDRKSDPGETDNRLEQASGVYRRLDSHLGSHLMDMDMEADIGSNNGFDVPDDVNQRLRDLGYQK